MKQGKRSILFEWAGSYLIVLIIPLITVFLNYNLNMETTRGEIYSAQKMVLDNTQSEIDRLMNQQVDVYNYLYTNPFLANWVSHREKNAEFYYDAARLRNQVRDFTKYSADVYCLMYMVDEEYIVHNEYANNAKHIYISLDTAYQNFPEYDEWISILSGDYNNEFLFLKYIDGRTDRKCLVYADSLELSGNKLVNIFVSVPMEKIIRLTDFLGDETYLMMYGHDQTEVIHGGEIVSETELQESISLGEETFEIDDYVGIVQKSAHKGFSYCMLIGKNAFWDKVLHIRNLFVVSLVITVLVAFGAVSFLMKRNFRPVSKLMEIIIGERKRGNEFYQIELAYSKLKNENKSLQQTIREQKEALLGKYMLSVMQKRGNFLSAEEMNFFGLQKDHALILGGFRVTSEDDLLRFAVDNVFTELMEGEFVCHMEDGEYMLYLFFVEPRQVVSLEEKCNVQANYLRELFQEKWQVTLEFRERAVLHGMEHAEELYKELMSDFSESEKNNGGATANEEIRGIVADVLEYVEKNYSDSCLNISAIADSINKNPKYISRVFKETMGEGILDYVNRIRIDRAKEIIATRRYSTEEAGAMAGYASNQTFRRAFIKIVGITPGKYMDSLCGSKK